MLIGYGNPGRGDDGLGPAFVEAIARRELAGLDCRSAYQLTVDHALMVTDVERVVFVDALMGAPDPFLFTAVAASEASSITSHSLSPAGVITLARTLYGSAPEALALGISGQVFGDVREGLSGKAQSHLTLAEDFFLDWYAGSDAGSAGCEIHGPLHA